MLKAGPCKNQACGKNADRAYPEATTRLLAVDDDGDLIPFEVCDYCNCCCKRTIFRYKIRSRDSQVELYENGRSYPQGPVQAIPNLKDEVVFPTLNARKMTTPLTIPRIIPDDTLTPLAIAMKISTPAVTATTIIPLAVAAKTPKAIHFGMITTLFPDTSVFPIFGNIVPLTPTLTILPTPASISEKNEARIDWADEMAMMPIVPLEPRKT
ncbi:uncharacterized protein EDB91DRAFT_1086154 [Suillus paluster]|uniref:uncharacterized protein n=1 Tax=Suillus paluster TaxID=48578 RepID=UPI001B87BFDB|nr:uncharacterized protein EDB91DRAFT_1086154 [Suillus paluster]KAG1728278.1 hypothetical protein EDB91DRAFT_1086154 [Suillus paluster]